jgi:hypothetical protein
MKLLKEEHLYEEEDKYNDNDNNNNIDYLLNDNSLYY